MKSKDPRMTMKTLKKKKKKEVKGVHNFDFKTYYENKLVNI